MPNKCYYTYKIAEFQQFVFSFLNSISSQIKKGQPDALSSRYAGPYHAFLQEAVSSQIDSYKLKLSEYINLEKHELINKIKKILFSQKSEKKEGWEVR